MAIVGYVCTADDLSAASDATRLRAAGAEIVHTATLGPLAGGKLRDLIRGMRRRDTLLITRLDHLAADGGELRGIVRSLWGCGIVLRAIDEPVDTSHIGGRNNLEALILKIIQSQNAAPSPASEPASRISSRDVRDIVTMLWDAGVDLRLAITPRTDDDRRAFEALLARLPDGEPVPVEAVAETSSLDEIEARRLRFKEQGQDLLDRLAEQQRRRDEAAQAARAAAEQKAREARQAAEAEAAARLARRRDFDAIRQANAAR
jgi:hypothetical protein